SSSRRACFRRRLDPAAPLAEEAVQVLWTHHRGKRVLAELFGMHHEGLELVGRKPPVRAEFEWKSDGFAAWRGGAEQDHVAGAPHAQQIARIDGDQRMSRGARQLQ